jgi:hypothetical protein
LWHLKISTQGPQSISVISLLLVPNFFSAREDLFFACHLPLATFGEFGRGFAALGLVFVRLLREL